MSDYEPSDDFNRIEIPGADELYSALYEDGYPPGPTGMLWGYLQKHGMPGRRERVLDAGCGYGVMVNRFRDIGCRVAGIDIATAAIAKYAGPEAIQGNVNNLPWSDNSFDLVWCCDVLEHLDDFMIYLALNEFTRVAPRLVATVCMRKSGWKGFDYLHKTVEGMHWWKSAIETFYGSVHVEQQSKHWLIVDAENRRE